MQEVPLLHVHHMLMASACTHSVAVHSLETRWG